MTDFPEFPKSAGTWTRIGLAADWLSQRMQANQDVAARGKKPGVPPILDPTPDTAELVRCFLACDGDFEERSKYCDSLSDWRIREACRAHRLLPVQNCRNWCLWQFGPQ